MLSLFTSVIIWLPFQYKKMVWLKKQCCLNFEDISKFKLLQLTSLFNKAWYYINFLKSLVNHLFKLI